MSREELKGKNAVVTGASSGIGRSITRALAAEGANVALIARGSDGLEAAAAEVVARGSRALVLPLDVADARAVDAAAERVVSEWGHIDLWVNNAMVSVLAPVEETTAEEYRRVMEVNYLGYVHGTLTALRHMGPRDQGLVLQIGSALAYRSIPLQSAYCASKAAIRGFTDSLRSELLHARSGVAISMLQLPAVNTPQFEVIRNRLGAHPQPVPPIYQPEVIARAVVHAVLHPKRELWIGWSTTKAIVGQRIAPGFLDHYLSKRAWDSQTTRRVPRGHPIKHFEDNLDAALDGDRGARGPVDDRARVWSVRSFLEARPFATLAAGLAAASLAVGSARRWLRI
jgi:NAD(P)-dependent dehydrogenase (short-subunit alcohol dehydrogenase family)